jgi:superkiller protein 8
LKDAHPLGCHHIAASLDGTKAVSVGFGGEAKVWNYSEGMWVDDGELGAAKQNGEKSNKKQRPRPQVGEIWAVALSQDGRYLAATSHDGRVGIWDLLTEERQKIREYETKGIFGMCVDMVRSNRVLLINQPVAFC